ETTYYPQGDANPLPFSPKACPPNRRCVNPLGNLGLQLTLQSANRSRLGPANRCLARSAATAKRMILAALEVSKPRSIVMGGLTHWFGFTWPRSISQETFARFRFLTTKLLVQG